MKGLSKMNQLIVLILAIVCRFLALSAWFYFAWNHLLAGVFPVMVKQISFVQAMQFGLALFLLKVILFRIQE